MAMSLTISMLQAYTSKRHGSRSASVRAAACNSRRHMCNEVRMADEAKSAEAYLPMQLDLLSLHLLHETKRSCQQG